MVPQYDIFRVRDDDTPVWLEPATTFHDAHARVQQFGASEPGEYFIFNQNNAQKIRLVVEPKSAPLKQAGQGAMIIEEEAIQNGERLESRRRGSAQGRRSGHVYRRV
jgi:hypothetical protein